jgi:hypothetical protein
VLNELNRVLEPQYPATSRVAGELRAVLNEISRYVWPD